MLTVLKQLKQLLRKPRNNSQASTGFKPMTSTKVSGSNPIEALEFFLGFLCNCFGCFVTARITFTSILYPQCILWSYIISRFLCLHCYRYTCACSLCTWGWVGWGGVGWGSELINRRWGGGNQRGFCKWDFIVNLKARDCAIPNSSEPEDYLC